MSNSVTERTMVYGRVGFATDEAKSAAEAIHLAHLDYPIEVVPAYHEFNGEFVRADKRNCVRRGDTGQVFGTVGERYVAFQNDETFEFADALADRGGLFESGFQQRGGAVVGLTMSFPDEIMIGGEDAIQQYLILRSKHDGSGCLIGGINAKRMWCLNQFDATMRAATNQVRIPHVKSLAQQVEQATKLLDISSKAMQQFKQDAETLLALPMTDEDVDTLCESVVREIKAPAKVGEAIKSNWLHSETIGDTQRNTGWGALNAIGEYFDHVASYRTNESALRSAISGRGIRAKRCAQRLLLNG